MKSFVGSPRTRTSRHRPTGAKTRQQATGTSQKQAFRQSQKPIREIWSPRQTRLRVLLVWSLLIVGSLGLGYRLYSLQVTQAPKLGQVVQQQQQVALYPFIPRRPIIDRNSDTLAIDQPIYNLYVHPIMFRGQEEAIATKLAAVLEQSPEQLLEVFQSRDTGVQIATDLPAETAAQIRNWDLNGIDLEQKHQRIYPYQDLFAGVVGFVNTDWQGQAGVELSQGSLLQRSPRDLKLTAMGNGELLAAQVPPGALHVDDLQLQLTLDSRLQRIAQSALRKGMSKFKAKRGTVIVMDSQDGSLLALVTEPSYNANKYWQADIALFKNWAVSDLYEPGSTFKPINVAIALEAGVITPTISVYDEGQIQVDGWPISNHDFSSVGGHGPLTISQVLEHSSNVGMVRIMQRLKLDDYYTWLDRLGLGDKTGIDLPFETAGNLKSREVFTWSEIEGATHAFGQGFALTPIQLARLHSALANGGLLVTPHVVRGLVDTDGRLRQQPERSELQRVFSPETTRTVLDMMENVVTQGTGRSGQVAGYRIAGKTGTAQKVSPYGYYGSGRITSFVGIFPVEAPRYVVLAVIDEPQGEHAYGSTVAAPIVKTVMEALVSMERVLPSQPDQLVRAAEPDQQ